MDKETKIDNEFRVLIKDIDDEGFWEYTRSWYDVQNILDVMVEWDTDTKKEAIKEMIKIIERRNKQNAKLV